MVRLRMENGGMLPPMKFLDISKKIRLYPKITRLMIEKTFALFSQNKKNFTINLAFDDIFDSKTREFILEMIKRYDIAKQVIFEILETQELVRDEEILSFIDEVSSIGAHIAIDDLGNGFANFEYLADYIKIEGSLARRYKRRSSHRGTDRYRFRKKVRGKNDCRYYNTLKYLAASSSLSLRFSLA